MQNPALLFGEQLCVPEDLDVLTSLSFACALPRCN